MAIYMLTVMAPASSSCHQSVHLPVGATIVEFIQFRQKKHIKKHILSCFTYRLNNLFLFYELNLKQYQASDFIYVKYVYKQMNTK